MSMIMRDGRLDVVSDVSVGDGMSEEVVDIAILCADCAALEVPLAGSVMWKIWVGVLKVGDCGMIGELQFFQSTFV